MSAIVPRINQNWRSGLTVAMVSLPLSVALSIASRAGGSARCNYWCVDLFGWRFTNC